MIQITTVPASASPAQAPADLFIRLAAPVAARIRAARRARVLSWGELAARSGVDAALIRDIEAGRRGISRDLVSRVAMGLNVDDVELYPGGRPGRYWSDVVAATRPAYRPSAASAPDLAA